MQVNKKEVGHRISELRKSKNLTMEQLADSVGASGKSTVSTWEKGITLPRPEFLQQLAKIFDVSIDYLRFGSLRHYLISLVVNDLHQEDSLTYENANKFLEVTTDFGRIETGLVLTEPFDIFEDAFIPMIVDAISEKFDSSGLDNISKFLGTSLKYNNDSELLKKMNSWFHLSVSWSMNTFNGMANTIMNSIDEVVADPGGANTHESVENVAKDLGLTEKEALDKIFQGKLFDWQVKAMQSLGKLKFEYEKQLKDLDNKHNDSSNT